jgi:glucose-6-phosphate-specific signal transduction histidine kinase
LSFLGLVLGSRIEADAVIEIADDGVSGADPARGSGLRGLADRVEALDGRLRVSSPAGGGTGRHRGAAVPVAGHRLTLRSRPA